MRECATYSLPVVMYHYINNCSGGTSVSPGVFEDHCRAMARKGWRGISLMEAEEYLLHGRRLPGKSALLTFDDGYLDNLWFAEPLLEHYGHKGVIFAVSRKLIGGMNVRERDGMLMRKVRNPIIINSLGHSIREDVFCNHAEIRAMHAGGVIAAASHSRGHFGVYTKPEYKGFLRPRDQLRTFFRTEGEFVWGMPDFPVGAGLENRAFLPDPDMVRAIKNLVPQEEGATVAFFAEQENTKALSELVLGHKDRLGRFETDVEQQERMWREIAGGKAELEAILGQPVRSLCWPWGRYSQAALNLAKDAGFQIFFTVQGGPNLPGRAEEVRRFKGKAKPGQWLLNRLWIYSGPQRGALYARLRG